MKEAHAGCYCCLLSLSFVHVFFFSCWREERTKKPRRPNSSRRKGASGVFVVFVLFFVVWGGREVVSENFKGRFSSCGTLFPSPREDRRGRREGEKRHFLSGRCLFFRGTRRSGGGGGGEEEKEEEERSVCFFFSLFGSERLGRDFSFSVPANSEVLSENNKQFLSSFSSLFFSFSPTRPRTKKKARATPLQPLPPPCLPIECKGRGG